MCAQSVVDRVDTMNSIENLTLHNNSLYMELPNVTSMDDNILIKMVPFIMISICAIGIPGNLIIIKIMTGPPFRDMSHSIICLALAITDMSYLSFLFINHCLEIKYGLYWMMMKLCRFQVMCVYVGLHIDAWLVTFLTFERFIVVFWPLRAGQLIPKTRIKIFLFFLVSFFLVWNSVYILRYDLFTVNYGLFSFEICDKINTFGAPEELLDIFDELTELFATFLPMTLIIIGNIGIIFKLHTQKAIRAQLTQGGANEMAKTNIMIITITSAFVLLMTPVTIYRLATGDTFDDFTDPYFLSLYALAPLNPAINCYLYFLSAKLFRDELKKLFYKKPCFKHRRRDMSAEVSVSTTRLSGMEYNSSDTVLDSHFELEAKIGTL